MCLNYLESTIETAALPEQIAALLFEPILVNGGMYVPPANYMKGIVKLCKDNDILIIMDEVYTGVGKSGNFLTVEQWGITPDILCLGKALGGGFPLAAVVTKREITDDTLGGVKFTSTFSGNLVACSTGLATINYLEKTHLDSNAIEIGNYLMKSLKDLGQERRRIGDVRGMGLLIGLDIVEDKDNGRPDGIYATNILRKAIENGLITRKVGRYNNILALTPPLVLTKTQAKEAVKIFGKIIDE
jgi:4-aminobutyrate aminotransferase-like enzyme